jgi:hypothetical protein
MEQGVTARKIVERVKPLDDGFAFAICKMPQLNSRSPPVRVHPSAEMAGAW